MTTVTIAEDNNIQGITNTNVSWAKAITLMQKRSLFNGMVLNRKGVRRRIIVHWRRP